MRWDSTHALCLNGAETDDDEVAYSTVPRVYCIDRSSFYHHM